MFFQKQTITYIWLISVHRNSLDSLSTSKEAADYQDNTVVNQTVIDRTTNTLRAVIEAQDEVSAEDMTWFFADYHGAPEGVQFMLSQESCEIYDLNDDPSLFPVLATALRGYAVHSHWDPVIRKLIRRGDDLHAQFRKHTCLCPSISQCLNCFCGSRRCVTPLDRMLGKIADPFEAKDVGNAWLNILPSEGCDVRVYLEKEETLHTAQSQMISSGNDYHLKQLVIELGANPSVSWRWWYDPSCSAYLVHEEFANWNIHHEDQSPWFRSEWTETWPFEYSESADPFDRHKGYIPHKGDEMYDEWKKLHDLAQSRAENRLKKRAAKLGLLGGQENSSMPGGWPNER